MKKVFNQFRQGILKYRKRLIYGALALFVGQFCFFNFGGFGIDGQVFAVSTPAVDAEKADQKGSFEKHITERADFLDFLVKSAYVLVYPLMFLAGKLVDNSFVYGEAFYFDTVLWNLRNTVRNLANFGLGFLFLYYVFRYLIKQKDSDKGPKWIITRSLVAGIGIQASWFIMAALIDLSTIMIYGVGGLPLSVLGSGTTTSGNESQNVYDPYALKTVVSVDVKDVSNTNIYLTNIGGTGERIYISECDTFSPKDGGGNRKKEVYILAPKMIYYQPESGNLVETQKNICHYYGSVHRFSSLIGDIDKARKSCEGMDLNGCKPSQSSYDEAKSKVVTEMKQNLEKISPYLSGGNLLIPGETNTGGKFGWDEDNLWIGSGDKTIKLKDVMKQQETKTYVGAFTSLYSSLLESGRGMIPSYGDDDTYKKFLSVLLTFGHVMAIAIPLAVAVLVLIMRIGVIWIAIVLSPMIVLLSSFGFLDKYEKEDGVLSYLQLENLLGIIFSPVVICFAISMSAVLVNLINKIQFKAFEQQQFEVLGLIQMDLAGFSANLSSLIVGVMGVAVSWFLVWTAVKMSKLGKSGVIKSVETLVKTSIGSMPVVPVPGKNGEGVDFIGVDSAFGLNGQKGILTTLTDKMKSEYNAEDQKTLDQLWNPRGAEDDAEEKRNANIVDEYSRGLFAESNITSDWTKMKIGDQKTTFNSLGNQQKKDVIEKINALGDSQKSKFGEVGQLNVGSGTYVWNESAKKFEINASSS